MALVTVPGGLWMPSSVDFAGATPAFTSILLDSTTDRIGVVFWPPKLGNIRKIGFLLGAVPALNAGSSLAYVLQDVSATTGFPDDSDDETATIAFASIVADTLVLSGNLSADRTISDLDVPVAAVVKFNNFTAGDQVNIKFGSVQAREPTLMSEYVANNLTGSYAMRNAVRPILEIEYDDGTHAHSLGLEWPLLVIATDTFNNTSTPDEIGLSFQVPMPCRLAGCWFSTTQAGNFNLNLYTSAAKTTVKAVDKDITVATATSGVRRLRFKTPVTLAANTTYVLAIEPSSATNIFVHNHTVRAAVAMDQMAGGQTWQYATAKDPATTADFTPIATKRVFMGLFFDQVDDGVVPVVNAALTPGAAIA